MYDKIHYKLKKKEKRKKKDATEKKKRKLTAHFSLASFSQWPSKVVVQGPRHFCLTQDPLYKVFALEFPWGLVKSEVKLLVAQSCPTPCDPKDCSPPGSSVHGILQARILKWWQFPSPGGSGPRDQRLSDLCCSFQISSSLSLVWCHYTSFVFPTLS